MAYKEHLKESPSQVNCAVITVSDTRDEASDKSGQLIKELLEAQGHQIIYYTVVKDSPLHIKGELAIQVERPVCQAIILNGGTGIAPRDHTYDTVAPLLDKKLDGFGEIFRYLSYLEIGSGAILSRAIAGTYRGRILFSLPGSTGAVRLAMEKLILPELGHMVSQVNKHL